MVAFNKWRYLQTFAAVIYPQRYSLLLKLFNMDSRWLCVHSFLQFPSQTETYEENQLKDLCKWQYRHSYPEAQWSSKIRNKIYQLKNKNEFINKPEHQKWVDISDRIIFAKTCPLKEPEDSPRGLKCFDHLQSPMQMPCTFPAGFQVNTKP